MRVRSAVLVSFAATALAVAPASPVAAQAGASASASPTTLKPGDTTTVSGTTDCASVGYTVTLTYTNPAGDNATTTASGTTDASGELTQAITVPETAVAGEPANVAASVDCSGGAQTTAPVTLTIEAHEGTLAVDPDEGPAGTEVTISGTNCWGDDVVVAFGDGEEFPFEVENVQLAEDRTFTATFTIPDEAGPGQYVFAAECPGTDFPVAPFTVTGDDSEGPGDPGGDPDDPTDDGSGSPGGGNAPTGGEAGPAMPVGGTPTFTG